MSNLKGADAGIAAAAAPTAATLGAAKSSVGSGLPGFASRTPGDLHYDTVTGKEYVLTGVAGTLMSDSFDTKVDGSVLSGTTETGGKTWVANSLVSVRSGTIISAVGAQRFAMIDTGVVGARSVSMTLAMSSAGNGNSQDMILISDTQGGYNNSVIAQFTKSNIVVQKGIAGTFTNLGSYTHTSARTAGQANLYSCDVDPVAGTIKVSMDGVQLLSVTTTLPAAFATTYTFVGVALIDSSSPVVSYADNFSTSTNGSLAWSQNSLPANYVPPAATASSLGVAKSTVGAGLPSFGGRNQGDIHYDSTLGQEYVLTGLPAGGPWSESFNTRANGSSFIGVVPEVNNGSATVTTTSSQNSRCNVNNQRIETTDRSLDGFSLQVGSGAQVVQVDLLASTLSANFFLSVRNVSGGRSDNIAAAYVLSVTGTSGNLYRNGTVVASFTATSALGTWALSVDNSTQPVLKAYVNGVLQVTYTDTTGSPYTGAFVSVCAGSGFAGAVSTWDNFYASATGTQAWTANGIAAVGSPGADTSSMHYKAAWSATPTYAKHDVVSRSYSLFVALTAVPINTDPFASSSNARVGSMSGDVTLNLNSLGSTGNRLAVGFTVNATTLVTGIELGISTQAGGVPAGVTVGIATGVTTATVNATFLTSVVAPALAAGTFAQVLFPSAVTLQPGTTYFAVVEGGTIDNISTASNASPPVLGVVASYTTGYTGTGNYAGGAGQTFPFRLDGNLQYWQKIGNTGNQENVGQVAASGAAQTIADPEIQSITRVVLTANATITLPPVAVGKSFTVVLIQDATGSRTVTFAGGAVIWPGGTAPTLTTTALKGDVLTFFADGSANWIGRVVGQNY